MTSNSNLLSKKRKSTQSKKPRLPKNEEIKKQQRSKKTGIKTMKKTSQTARALRAQDIYASSNDEGTEDLNDAFAGTSNSRKRENQSVGMLQIPVGSNKAFINPEEYFQNFHEILSKFNLVLRAMYSQSISCLKLFLSFLTLMSCLDHFNANRSIQTSQQVFEEVKLPNLSTENIHFSFNIQKLHVEHIDNRGHNAISYQINELHADADLNKNSMMDPLVLNNHHR